MKMVVDAWAALPNTHSYGEQKVLSLEECKEQFNERALTKLKAELLPWDTGYFLTSEPRGGNVYQFKKVLEREFLSNLQTEQGPMGYKGFFFPNFSREQAEKLEEYMTKWGYDIELYDDFVDCEDYPDPTE